MTCKELQKLEISSSPLGRVVCKYELWFSDATDVFEEIEMMLYFAFHPKMPWGVGFVIENDGEWRFRIVT